MVSQDLAKFNLPDNPGVYFFKKGREILYIGKATSLKDRVRSYFSADLVDTRGEAIVQMVELADAVSFLETDSALEALILEAFQISKYKPKYNVRGRDDKSFNFVGVTNDDYPRVLLVRGKELADEGVKLPIASARSGLPKYRNLFGPFPYGSEIREALKIIRRIFPYRTNCIPAEEMIAQGKKPKPCFDSQIGLEPGVCSGRISKEDYGDIVRQIERLFEGKKQTIVKDLERKMHEYADRQEFELAGVIKRRLFALTHIRDVSLIKNRALQGLSQGKHGFRIEAYDIAHTGGTGTVGVFAVVENGEPQRAEYRKFRIRGESKDKANDTANLKEVLLRRFNHPEWPEPDLIVVDGGKAQLNLAERTLESLGAKIPVVGVVKDEYHRPREIIGDRKLAREWEQAIILANSESHRYAIHFHRQSGRRVV